MVASMFRSAHTRKTLVCKIVFARPLFVLFFITAVSFPTMKYSSFQYDALIASAQAYQSSHNGNAVLANPFAEHEDDMPYGKTMPDSFNICADDIGMINIFSLKRDMSGKYFLADVRCLLPLDIVQFLDRPPKNV